MERTRFYYPMAALQVLHFVEAMGQVLAPEG
jgi:hypothetical protein